MTRAAQIALLFAAVDVYAQAQQSPTPSAVDAPVNVVEVASGLDHPWGLAFLPDGSMLVTERSGQLLRIAADGKTRRAVGGVPGVRTGGQAGLLDVALSPTFGTCRQMTCTSSSEASFSVPRATAVPAPPSPLSEKLRYTSRSFANVGDNAIPSNPPWPPARTRGVPPTVRRDLPSAAIRNSCPERSVTSMLPSGRNARAHG